MTTVKTRAPRKKKMTDKALQVEAGLYFYTQVVAETGFNPSVDKGPDVPEFESFAAALIDEHCPAIPTLHDLVQQLTGRQDVTNVLYEIKSLEDFIASMDESKAANTDKVSVHEQDDTGVSENVEPGRDADPERGR